MPLIGAPVLGPRLVGSERFVRFLESWFDEASEAWEPEARASFVSVLGQPERARATQRLYGTWWYRELVPVLAGRYAALRLDVPTLWLHGARDRAIRPELLRGWQGRARELTFELLPELGHFPFEEAPERVVPRIREFLGDR